MPQLLIFSMALTEIYKDNAYSERLLVLLLYVALGLFIGSVQTGQFSSAYRQNHYNF